jgi:phosphohistidine swiveling domain-containing protein
MINQRKQYVISVSNLNESPLELVGAFAQDIDKIQKLSINTPNGFVITSQAFDDFLIANDLLEYISPRINDVDYDDKNSVKKASEEIMHAIMISVVPDIISAPILQAYSNLSGFYDAFVSIKKSPIHEALDETNYSKPIALMNVSGKEQLLTKIKELWSQIFTVEALMYRVGMGYEGYLTSGLVVQKMLQSEASGKLYSVAQNHTDINTAEIQAFFGLEDKSLWNDMHPDSYLINKKTEEIIEKKINGQDWMLVRKGRSADKNSIVKIPISKLWQKKQKLDDKFITLLTRYGKLLEQAFNKAVEVEWDYEAGKIYIVSFVINDSVSVDVGKEEPIEAVTTNEEIRSQDPRPIAMPQTPKKSLDYYVDEIQKISEDTNKVVVDIKPVEELQLLTTGRAKGKGLVFGLIHIVFTDTDYSNLTGDEILVVNKIDPDMIGAINTAKGLIIQGEIDEEIIKEIKIPVILDVQDAFDIFQEGEVVTLRMWNGSIYMGAGKDNDADEKKNAKYAEAIVESKDPKDSISDESPKIISKSDIFEGAEIIPIDLPKTSQKVPTLAKIEAEPFDYADDKSPEKEVEVDVEKSMKFSQEQKTEKKVQEVSMIENILPKTVTDFWQVYLPGEMAIDTKNIDGLIVRVVDVIEEYSPETFSKKLAERLVELLNKVDGKPLILISAGRGKKIEEIVESELDAIDSLRNRDMMRNLWYSFDNISLPEDLIKLKKIFTSKGFRRSSTFKLFLTVHNPHSMISLKGLLDNDIDGVIIDLDMLIKEHAIPDTLNDEHLSAYVAHKIDQINKNKTVSILLAAEEKVEVTTLKIMVKAGLTGVGLNLNQIYGIKPKVAQIETVKKVENKKKRGRKRKEVDFGF